MKNKRFWTGMLVLAAVFVISFTGCVSMKDRELSFQERASVETVEQVTVNFSSWQILHIPNSKKIKNKAYLELRKIAQERHGTNADVANIVITGGWSWLELLNLYGNIFPITGGLIIGDSIDKGLDYQEGHIGAITAGSIGVILSLIIGNTQKITVTGDVILHH